MKEHESYGGFIYESVKRWLLKECIESGDPDNFFLVIKDVIDDIDIQSSEQDNYWTCVLEGSE